MTTLTDARQSLADAVTSAGLECAAYPPQSPNLPTAWVDSLSVEYANGSGFSFCVSGDGSATIVSAGPAHDKAGSTQILESLTPAILQALQEIPGVRVAAIQSGTVQIVGQDLPSVLYSVAFAISS